MLITINPDNSITVHKVKEVNKAIKWKELPKRSLNVPQTGGRFDCHKDIDIREEEEESLGTLLTTSSLLTPTPAENPEVSPKGEQKNTPLDASSKVVTPKGPEVIHSLAQFRAARPSGPEEIHHLAFEVIDSLSLPDQIAPEVEELIAAYPVAWTRDCILTVRDKQQRILEGTDTTGFTDGPVAYLAGSLARKLEALKHSSKKIV